MGEGKILYCGGTTKQIVNHVSLTVPDRVLATAPEQL